ncbi:MAG: hypothetical protein DWB56_05775 [Candidatus Jettenia sp.]|uniref:Uncharacterized protein n=1 Tax=Candidatus Jettenia caeni TaxID=247490 RepID=I3INR5_9BACT|nr:hypothetical protein [Candidatus Jettenia sp. AMX1]MBC6928463.1 hypothetical protein [Candidatus Jettenia sp.]NUN24782.1 hypothetical protein [Candidatus Jettenia caeni]KAA0250421.1 MAG: hypothetical protein EDM77_04775 [Candidatus Jettenia sp. AMX1]MCE7879608.1 hypothetical protein [Candidatus Jettenia sp. AMX1]MCQ3926476.1 hypothetical protein [Candidatus Jettenia sp.]
MRKVLFSFAKSGFYIFLNRIVLLSLFVACTSYGTSVWVASQISMESSYNLPVKSEDCVGEVNSDEQLRDNVAVCSKNIPIHVKHLNLYNNAILLRALAQVHSPPSPPTPPPLPLPIPKPNPLFVSYSVLLLQYIEENIRII